ncbi:MAG: hypothetical protein IPM49_08695 [Flavobacteriales bacterium]|nr:hypothetical protein [Flavobacteriales bacterium]
MLSDGRVVDEELVKAIEQDMPLADLNLWPNPARDVLNIALNTYAEARVEMSDQHPGPGGHPCPGGERRQG